MLELEGVAFQYEDMTMRFDLRVERGELMALIGPSGAGKSSLLSLIAGFDKPSAGTIRIDGQAIDKLPPAARPLTILFQENNLFAHLTVAQNVGLGLRPNLRLTAADLARRDAALEEVGLRDLADRLPGQMSGGERQRAALARCLVRDRPLLLLDEPFAALGPGLRREMLDLVNRLRRARGLTVLLVSHHPDDARYAADRTAFVEAGRIARCLPTPAFFAEPLPPSLARYLGDPEA